MTPTRRPPRPSQLAAAILRALTSPDRAAAILGDLQEDLAGRALSERARYPRLWIEWHAWRYALAGLGALLPRLTRSGGFALRDAWRSLRSAPAASLFMLLILTIGIGAATVTFSVVDAVVLRPLPFGEPHRLIAVEYHSRTPDQVVVRSLSAFLFASLEHRMDSSGLLAATTGSSEVLATGAASETIVSARVTASLFDVLGVQPLLGQAFTAANEVSGDDDVAIIGYDLWQRRYAGDPGIVGRTIELAARGRQTGEKRAVTVLGIMPRGFAYPIAQEVRPEMWTPYVIPADEQTRSTSRYLHVVGRLAPGTSREQVQSFADSVLADALPANQRSLGDARLVVTRLDEALFGPVRAWMLLALTAVGLVMFVACANVANLLLSRTARRARELSVRASIGASRRHLVVTLLTESLLLSLTAAALGLVLAIWGVDAARSALPASITRLSEVALDLRVLVATIAAAIATGLTFGAVPAWQAARTDLVSLLKTGSSSVTWGRPGWRSAFLVAQVAFVVVLLVSTMLFVTSFIRVARADLGFDRSDVSEVRASGLTTQLIDVLRDLRTIPGVSSVAAVAAGDAPLIAAGFGGGSSGTGLRRAGVAATEPQVSAMMLRVSAAYFNTMGMRIMRGRTFEDAEIGRGETVVLDQLAARALFGDQEAVGARLTYGNGVNAAVVGVVSNVRMRGPGDASGPQVYLPANAKATGHVFVLRGSPPPASLTPSVESVLAGHRPAGASPAQVRRIEDAFRNITADRRFAAGLMSLFGVLALTIGAVGIYAVMSSLAAQQTREFGIRIALGATAGAIVAGMLQRTAKQIALALAIGLPAGWALARVFASLLFEIGPSDATSSLMVVAVIGAVGLLAAAVPAARAARVDPMITLKTD